MAKDEDGKILGDINPNPSTLDHIRSGADAVGSGSEDEESGESMNGGSQHDRVKHAGSRDVTEGTTVGTETGGVRNMRSGSGAVGVDIGNRPE
jgi:hypothetical protein